MSIHQTRVLPEMATDTPTERWLVACPGFGQYLHDPPPSCRIQGRNDNLRFPKNKTVGQVWMH